MLSENVSKNNQDLIHDPEYIRQLNNLINDSLSKGFDVAEFSDGTVITTEVKVTEMKYIWNFELRKLMKVAARRAL